MNDNHRRTYEKFVRIRGFGETHGSEIAPASLGHQLFLDIVTVVADFNRHAAAEASGHGDARQGTEIRALARASLRERMEAIVRTARALENEVPGIQDKFRMPRGSNDRDLINAARAFKADAEPLKAHFMAHEMPADFLDELQEHIDDFEEAISDQSSGVGNRVAAGAALDEVIERGNDLVRKLDAIVRNKYANNAAVLAEWTSASHTERAPRRAKPEQPPAPPTT
jgi:hypothetical protein